MNQPNWETRKISEQAKQTAHHIGIISEGAIQTLIDEIRQEERERIIKMIKCEIDCIKSGNSLTPAEQEQCLKVTRNIIKRINP